MSTSRNDLDADTIMIDSEEEQQDTSSTSRLDSSIDEHNISRESLSYSLNSGLENLSTETNTAHPPTENRNVATSPSILEGASNINQILNSGRILSPLLRSSHPLLVVGNTSMSSQEREYERPRRSSFLSRDNVHIENSDSDDSALAGETEGHPLAVEEDSSLFHYDDDYDEDEGDDEDTEDRDHRHDEEEDEDEEDHDGEEDEDDDEDDDNIFRRSQQPLLRSIRGAFGMPDVLADMVGRINPSIEAMSNREDPSDVMAGLQELAGILLMTNEDVLTDYLPTSKVIAAIADIMTDPLYEDNVEICIMACRCLSNLLDANPTSLDRVSYEK